MADIHLGSTCEQFKDASYYQFIEDQRTKKVNHVSTRNALAADIADQRFADYKANPKFCIITPTPYLDDYASQSSMHLVLAHLVDTDDSYAEFYASRREFKIMDNGAFELGESYAPEKLIELGIKCKADVIVLPDYPAQHQDKTIQAAIDLAPQVHAAGFKTFFVPQSYVGDMHGFIEAYTWAALDNELIDVIGLSILAVPNAIPRIHKAYSRVVMTERLITEGVFAFDKPHHYLGLNSGPNLEIPSLISMGALTSCDSSNPVWAGICGSEYSENTDSFMTTRKISKHVDFDYPFVKDTNVHRMIQKNIDLTLGLFQ